MFLASVLAVPPQFLRTATAGSGGSALTPSSADAFKCEICLLVAQSREDQSGGGCSTMDMFRETCVEVLRSFTLWSKWIDLWLRDLGCHKVGPNGLALARPCPGHAVCSWIISPIDHLPFCAADNTYRSPAPLPPRESDQTVEQSAHTTTRSVGVGR